MVIVGGGPAGVLMARQLKKRGHPVTIVEKSDRIGGKACSVRHTSISSIMTLILHACTLRRKHSKFLFTLHRTHNNTSYNKEN